MEKKTKEMTLEYPEKFETVKEFANAMENIDCMRNFIINRVAYDINKKFEKFVGKKVCASFDGKPARVYFYAGFNPYNVEFMFYRVKKDGTRSKVHAFPIYNDIDTLTMELAE